jgi:hypothetical protein
MPFEVHMLQNNGNQERVEVIVYSRPTEMGDRILHIAEVNIQKPATGETGALTRKMSFVFGTKDQAIGFQLAMLEAESVV